MRAVTIGLLAVLSVCLTVEAPAQQRQKSLTYVKPAGRPAAPIDVTVAMTAANARARIRSNLERAGLSLMQTNDRDVVAATYSGRATPWIDCGWIFSFEQGQRTSPKRVGGAADNATIIVRRGDRSLQMQRTVTLDGLVAVNVESAGAAAHVTGKATYVVTRTISARDGEAETVMTDFGSGEIGSFEKGTTCLPTGQFERLVTQGLPRVR